MSNIQEKQTLTQEQAQYLADQLKENGLHRLALVAQQIADFLKGNKNTGWYREICGTCGGTGITHAPNAYLIEASAAGLNTHTYHCPKCYGAGIVMVNPVDGSEHPFIEKP